MCATNDCDAPDPHAALGHATEPSRYGRHYRVHTSCPSPPPRTSVTTTTRPSASPSRLPRTSPLSSTSILRFSPDCNEISCRLARDSSGLASAPPCSMRHGLLYCAGRALLSRATAAASLLEWTLHLDLGAPLSSHRHTVSLLTAFASSQQYPSIPDPTDIAYFLVVVHLRDGHDSTTLAWLVASASRLFLASAPTPLPRLRYDRRRLPPVPRNRRVPPACLPHLHVLRFSTLRVSAGCEILVPGRVWLVPGATRSCSGSRTLRKTTTRRTRAVRSFSLLRRLCAETLMRMRLSTSIWTSYRVLTHVPLDSSDVS
ncbi:hypothetical protein DFH08DRAFT_953418 [Mycena albidolilacea]|uniref:Uncharacterized protein n=1 Tax=Mycena albidolilacea TaxID=1033008 RepID=A0AAD7AGQ3_9AGAR|nr:hypothetical protein DFH08DRAFT_953418 [Mycena albidolilacea]